MVHAIAVLKGDALKAADIVESAVRAVVDQTQRFDQRVEVGDDPQAVRVALGHEQATAVLHPTFECLALG